MPVTPWPPLPFPTAASWRQDRALRNCSLAARGLWIDLLALMHQPELYARFRSPVTGYVLATELTQLLNCSSSRIMAALDELEEVGLIDRTQWDHPVIPRPRHDRKKRLTKRPHEGTT